MVKLSVIIVNYRGWGPLSRCLEALNCLKDADFSSEVIIVDNFSNDGKLKEFSEQRSSFRFIENTGNYGFSSGNNLGARSSNGEYLLFLNPDTVINLPALSEMIKKAEEYPEYHILSCQQEDEDGKDKNPFGSFPSFRSLTGFNRAIYRLFGTKDKVNYQCNGHGVIFPDWVSGSLIFMKREIFYKIGGWCEDFWLYSEDVDLCKRVSERGGKVAFLCDIRIIHQHGGVTRQGSRLKSYSKAHVLISRHIYISKHYRGAKHVLLQMYLVITNLFELLLPAALGLILFFIPAVRVYFHLFVHLLSYYIKSIFHRTWLPGPHKVNFPVK